MWNMEYSSGNLKVIAICVIMTSLHIARTHGHPLKHSSVTSSSTLCSGCDNSGTLYPTEATPTRCSGCGNGGPQYPIDSPHAHRGISEEERAFRTELVKLKILKALGLEKPPNVTTPLPTIPVSEIEAGETTRIDRETEHPETQRVILIGRKVPRGCSWDERALCVHFQDDENGGCPVKSEKLRIYMNSNITDDVIVSGDVPSYFKHRIRKNASEIWTTIELPPRRRQQSFGRNLSFTFDQDEERGPMRDYFGSDAPLIEVVYEDCTRSAYRLKRSLTQTHQCVGAAIGPEPQCCLQQFEVNVQAIGWGAFFAWPSTFSANYCRGRCNLHVIQQGTNHAYMTYMASQLEPPRPQMIPCCAPVAKRGLDVYVRVTNTTFRMRTIPGISATGCECL